MPFNTRNPIPSGDLRDLDDNARNIDTWANDKTKLSHPDRFGVERRTWHGIEQEAKLDIAAGVADATAEAGKYRDQALDAKNAAQEAAMMSGFSKYADTLAQLEAGIGTDYVEGDVVMVFQDESRGDTSSIFKIESGVSEFKLTFDKTRQDLLSFTGNISADAEWSDVPAHSDPAFDVQTQALANRTETLNKRTEGLINVRAFIDTPIDGVTSNQAGIEAAVAEAYAAGADLEWPAGTYVSTENIPNFWKIQHRGKGVIKRGSNVFTICPRGKSTALNQIFVSLSGGDTNDGLTADYPLRTAQSAFDAIMSVGASIGGRWEVVFDSGTYNEYATLSGVVTREPIIIRGPDVAGGIPTVVFDGTGLTAQSLNGFLLRDGIYAVVRDIKFSNWNGGTGVGTGDASTGLNAVQECNVWADNVHAKSCGTGVSATRSRIYQGKGVVEDCDTGSTAFGNTVCTYGYGGATTYRNCSATAINIRDGSAGVVDGMISENNNVGIRCQNQSHTRVSNAVFTNSGTADVYLYTGSSCFFGNGNTHTPGKKMRSHFAMDLAGAAQIFYNADSDRFNFGFTSTPAYKFHFRDASVGAFATSSALVGIESANPQIAFNGNADGTFGFQCAIPGTQTAAYLLYTAADGNWRVRANNVDSYRFASTVFRPVADNSVALGGSASRWSQVYAGTGTINTSDAREKQQIRELTDAERAVAVRLKSLIRAFKFNDAVESKGDKARIHVGVIAQDVKVAFEAEGLVAEDYAVLCYDEWDEQPEVVETWDDEFDGDGNLIRHAGSIVMEAYRPAGNRYGIRYDELCMFILAAM